MRTRPLFALTAALVLTASASARADDPPPPDPPSDPPPAPPKDVAPPPAPPKDAPPAPPQGPPKDVAPPVDPPPDLPLIAIEETSDRALRGHLFPTPLLVDRAFVLTTAGLTSMLAVRSVPGVEVLNADGTGVPYSFTYDRSLGVTAQELDVAIAIRKVVDLDLMLRYETLLPRENVSTAVFGAASSFEARPGVRVRLLRRPSSGTLLGAHAFGVFVTGARQTPAQLFAAVAKDLVGIAGDGVRRSCLLAGDLECALGSDVDPSALSKVSRSELGAGAALTLAQGFNSYVGLQVMAGFSATKATVKSPVAEASAVPVTAIVGVAPTLDLNPIIPFGAMIEYRLRATVESAFDTTTLDHAIAATVLYTGKKELNAGLSFRANVTMSSVNFLGVNVAQPTATDLGAMASIRYFF